MKIRAEFTVNLKTEEVKNATEKAVRAGLVDIVTLVANEAIHQTLKKTGNNMRSIFYGVTGMEHKQASEEGRKEGDTWTGEDKSILDESKIEGAVYSTSGYGGYLETGTVKMSAHPYMKPALDRNFTPEKFAERVKRHMK